MRTEFFSWVQRGIAAGLLLTTALVIPQIAMAQEGGESSAADAAASEAPAANKPAIVANPEALAQFLADPAAFLAQEGDLAAVIAVVALADPSVVAQIEAAVAGEGVPEGAAEAVAQGLVDAAVVAAEQGVPDQTVADMVAAAMRTDVSTADAVANLAISSDSKSLTKAISDEMVAVTKTAIAGGAGAGEVATLVKATVVADPGTAQEIVSAAEGASQVVATAVGTGLGQGAQQLQEAGDISAGAEVVRVVAVEGTGAVGAGFTETVGETFTADVGGAGDGGAGDGGAGDGGAGDGGAGDGGAADGGAGDGGAGDGGAGAIGGGGASPGGTPATGGGDVTGGDTGDTGGAPATGGGATGGGGGATGGGGGATGGGGGGDVSPTG